MWKVNEKLDGKVRLNLTPGIPPFLMGLSRRVQAAVLSFIAGVMLPMPMLGRSMMYAQSHSEA